MAKNERWNGHRFVDLDKNPNYFPKKKETKKELDKKTKTELDKEYEEE